MKLLENDQITYTYNKLYSVKIFYTYATYFNMDIICETKFQQIKSYYNPLANSCRVKTMFRRIWTTWK